MAVLLSAVFSAGQAQVTAPPADVILHGASASLPATSAGVVTVSGDVGTRQGSNLLHTFSVFNVFAGQTVMYTLPTAAADIGHVVSRVTGGTSTITGGRHSFIGGRIDGIPGASFWFINPNGIVFGNGALLASASSFHFSTADYVKLGDNGVVFANPSDQRNLLTVAAPSAFGFLTANPAAITVGTTTSSVLRPLRPDPLKPAPTLSLVGGPINVGAPAGTPVHSPGTPPPPPTAAPPPGFILVDGGRLNLVSVASPGEVTFDGKGFNVDAFPQLGDVNIKQRSIVDAREVFIRGGRLTIENSAVIPGFFSPPRSTLGTAPNGGEVNVKVSNEMKVSGSALVFNFRPGINTFSGSSAAIGPPRDVPDITIQAGSLSVSGLASIQSDRFGPGNAADVVINTDSLEVRNGGSISVNNFFRGAGGTLTVNAQHVELSGDGNTGFTGIAGQSNFNQGFNSLNHDPATRRDARLTDADGATVTINATGPGTLIVRQGAEISTDSFGFGRAGDINIRASDIFLSRDGAPTGSIASQSLFAGPSGNVKINASGRIVMSGGFQVSATTGGTGDGGTVDVSAGKSISMEGANTGIFSTTVRPPQSQLDAFARNRMGAPLNPPQGPYAFLVNLARRPDLPNPDLHDVLAFLNGFLVGGVPLISVPDVTIGNAGKITVTTPQLSMSNGARIDNSTAWAGNAGEILANLGSLSLASGAQIRSRSGLVRLSTGLLEVGSGNAGKVTVNATDLSTITITGSGSAISTSTFGDGDGGAIRLASAGQLVISDGGSVTADSFGTGLTGDVTMTAGSSIFMDHGTVSTRATTSDGGNITLLAPNMIKLDDSQITTSVQSGTGGGGNISIDPQFLILNGTTVTANAFGGPGGNITIVANNFLPSSNSVIQASSALSTSGTIQIESPENNVAGSIAQLSPAFLDASRLLRGLCSARRAGAPSSFVVAGRGGVPADADGYLPSFSAAGAAAFAASDAGAPQWLGLAMADYRDCAR